MHRIVAALAVLFCALVNSHAEQVVISEIMYHPTVDKPEFIELWNITNTPLDFAKWRFSDGVTYEFPDFNAASPQDIFLKAGERIIVSAADPATTRTAYGIPSTIRVYGPWIGALDNAGEKIALTDKNGVGVCSVSYKDGGRWPRAADGTGHSLVLKNENNDIGNARNWRQSSNPNGSPGTAEPASADSSVRLSEVHFTSNGSIDWVELQNLGGTRDATGLFLASANDLSDKVPLSGNIPGSGFTSYDVNFAAEGSGNAVVYLVDNQNRVLGVADMEHTPGRDSLQAVYPNVPLITPSWQTTQSAPEWYSSTTPTRDAANNPPITTSIVINEIMCDPPSNETAGEFVELYNNSASAVGLARWKLRGAVDFDFPPGASIPAGGFVVVGGDTAYLQSAYPGATVIGNWSGKLGNKGDLIRLIDQNGNLADEVDYRVGGDWPDLAAGFGSSLELINPNMDNSRASAWRASDESNKTAFQTYTVSGPYLQLNSLGAVTDFKEIHMFLVGDSHCIVQNFTVQANGSGANLLTNGNLLSTNGLSASGWLCQGTHWSSFVDGTGALHLIGDGHGDNRPNRAEIDCTALTQNTNYTFTFQARWVSGKPRLIVQTWDHSIGNSFLLPVPNNLGTAGAANSAFQAAAPPQVDSVLHSPAVPKSTDVVRITARVVSQTPISAVEVLHRADTVNNTNSFVASPMFDDGTNGDSIAGDGIYTAAISAHQVANRIVQFYVRATAQGGATMELPKGGASRPALWLVDNRTIDSRLRRQRFVISLYDRDALQTSSGQSPKFQYDFPRLSNHYFNCTFISNESDVYYNAEIRKSGSPWTRSDGNELSRGKWKLPGDRVFRSHDKFNFDNDAGGTAQHHNRIIRYWLYLFGHPANENEFIFNLINSDGIVMREDVEPVDADLLNRCFPNGTDGQLLRSDDEWWFQDNWTRANRDADWSYKGTDNLVRYHTEWMMRSRESDYDYSSFIEFCKTVSNGSSNEEQFNRVIDQQLALMMAAVRGYAYDWDSFTLNRGKNGYFYRRPTDGKWMFLHWDSDLAFQDAANIVVGSRPGWGNYIGKTYNRRIFNNWLTEVLKLTSGPKSARTIAFLDAEEAASPVFTVSKSFYQSWFTNRRSRIETEIGAAYTAAFVVTTPTGTTGSATQTLNGTAPSSAYTIQVVGHPEGVLSWSNQTNWQISGLVLATGLNTFTVQTVDYLGNVLATTTYTITKTGDAPPLMALGVSPASQNAALGSQVILDAGGSYDPEAGALTFEWSNTPLTGVTVSVPNPSSRIAVFDTPGVYSFSVTATDPASSNAPISREITAYSFEDFAAFNAQTLEPYWTVQNAEQRDSYSNSAFYSLEDTPNNLVVQVLNDTAKPLAYNAPTHPLLLRPLPATADFSLQTDVVLEARRTGTFGTGLYVEVLENGSPVRYAFGLDGGNSISVKRLTAIGITSLASQSSTGIGATIRVRRVGAQLRFDRRTNGVWTGIFTQPIPADATAVKGGLFVSTASAENVRVAFDYLLLADPTHTATVAGSLRITEIMYNPAFPETVEYIELKNVGTQTINLQGVHFDQGAPTDAFTFGNVPLGPGQYAVITGDGLGFEQRYGFAPTAQWPGGSMSNGGERITLRDASNNLIHDFSYSDTPPWPVAADGQGPSLEVIDLNGDYGSGTNWRASFEIGGSPGLAGAGPDTDGDGQPDSWEAIFGTNPNSPDSRFTATGSVDANGQPQLTFPTVAGKQYRVEFSDTLTPTNWQTLTTIDGTGAPVTYTDTTTPKPAQRFYQVVVVP